jgi:hypothetical protein
VDPERICIREVLDPVPFSNTIRIRVLKLPSRPLVLKKVEKTFSFFTFV